MSGGVFIKCLRENGRSVHSFIDAQGHRGWDLPQDGRPGAWKGPVEGVLRPHHNGLHLAKQDYLIDWLTGHHYIAETQGETAEGLDCIVARTARLTEYLPIDTARLEEFCKQELTLLPKILDTLTVYPNISNDVRVCVNALQDGPLSDARQTLSRLPEFRHIRMNSMRLSYDALHSIEYHHCTATSRQCLDTLVGIFRMASMDSRVVDYTKVISNNTATALQALSNNAAFMEDLCRQGYDHKEESRVMKAFIRAAGLEDGEGHDVFSKVRQRQNRQILPALGLK